MQITSNEVMDILIYGMVLLLSLEQIVNFPFERHRKLEPIFVPTPNHITVPRGELVVLKCHIKYLGSKKVVWRKWAQDFPLTTDDSMFSQEENLAIETHKLSENENLYNLIITDVQLRHSGTYICQVTATKMYAHYVTLNVLGIQISGTNCVGKGSQILLRCNVTGISRTPDDVDWFLNGERIITSLPKWQGRTQMHSSTWGKTYMSELIVETSTPSDNGTYVCRSSGNSYLDMDSIVVNVLSADTPNVRCGAESGKSGYIGRKGKVRGQTTVELITGREVHMAITSIDTF